MRETFTILAAVLVALAVGCGSDEANTLEGNVEQSKKVMEEGYDAARAKGQDAVEAAGDAYNDVLDEDEKKAAQ